MDSFRLGAFQEFWKESDLASEVGSGADSEIHSSVMLALAYKGSCQNYRDL